MGGVFFYAILFCGAVGLFTGRGEALGTAVLACGEEAVRLGLTLCGSYMVFGGILKVLERGGALRLLSGALRRPMRWLLGPEGRDEAVRQSACANLTANLLGLGGAATPAGLAAMRRMAERAPKERTTRGMCVFVLCNIAVPQLVPATVLSLRAAAGAARPGDIVLPALLGSLTAAALSVWLSRLCERAWPK